MSASYAPRRRRNFRGPTRGWRRRGRRVLAAIWLALSAGSSPARADEGTVCAGADARSVTPDAEPVSRYTGLEPISRSADEPLEATARRLIPAGAKLATEPVELELPPLGRIGVILFREEEDTNYTGWVLVPERGQAPVFRKVVLPPLPFAGGLFDVQVKSVFAATVGSGPGRELCVLYWWYQFGTGSENGHETEVYRWTGSAFERRDDAGRAVAGLTTAGKVREKLKRWRPAPANRN